MLGEIIGDFLWEVVASGVGEVLGAVLSWLWRAYARALNVPILAGVLLDCAAGTAEGVLLGRGAGWEVVLGTALVVGCPSLAIASTVALVKRLQRERRGGDAPALEPVRPRAVAPGLPPVRLRTVDLRTVADPSPAIPPRAAVPRPHQAWGWSSRVEVASTVRRGRGSAEAG